MSQSLKDFFSKAKQDTDPSVMPHLKAALDVLYNKPRNGVHVSDLVNCARKASFRRQQPVKTTMTELNFFTLGKALHQAAQDLVDQFPDIYTQEQEVWLTAKGETIFKIKEDISHLINRNTDVVAHIDIYNFKDNVPVEMKGVRKDKIDEPKSFHVQQLKYYMAMTGAHKGIVLYQLLLHYKDSPFKEFVVTMTDAELQAERDKLLGEAKKFSDSILESNPRLATDVWNNKELNYQCRTCNYFPKCREWQLDE